MPPCIKNINILVILQGVYMITPVNWFVYLNTSFMASNIIDVYSGGKIFSE